MLWGMWKTPMCIVLNTADEEDGVKTWPQPSLTYKSDWRGQCLVWQIDLLTI